MTKTPHEIFDGSEHDLIPPESVIVIMGEDGDRIKYIRADIAEQAVAKERYAILKFLDMCICMAWTDNDKDLLMGIRDKIQQRNNAEAK